MRALHVEPVASLTLAGADSGRYLVSPPLSLCVTLLPTSFMTRRHPENSCGIVYCFSKKDCEAVSNALNDHFGRPVSTYYHAGIDGAGERERHQAAWSRGHVNIVCATIAFGACRTRRYRRGARIARG